MSGNIQIRVKDSFKKRITNFAEENGWTVSKFVKESIKFFLDRKMTPDHFLMDIVEKEEKEKKPIDLHSLVQKVEEFKALQINTNAYLKEIRSDFVTQFNQNVGAIFTSLLNTKKEILEKIEGMEGS